MVFDRRLGRTALSVSNTMFPAPRRTLNYKSVAKNQQTFHIQLCGSSISPS